MRITTILFFVLLTWQNLLAQTACYETVTLPADSKWGGGDAQGSPLIGNTYGPGQGPGIYIVADGGYRLYLNGELLAYDNAAGRVRFIPMTFLPLKNSISVVGINGQNAPGVLIHVDELEKPYVSSTSWKGSATPSDNTWKNSSYNDASWASATVVSGGSLTQTPSGMAFTGMPSTSAAKWIWSNNTADKNVVLRYTFTIKAVGYGQNTTGGEGGTVVYVKTADELATEASSTGAKIIIVPEGLLDFRNNRDQSVCYQTCADKLTNGGYNGDWITNGATCPGTTRTVKRWEKLIWVRSNKTIVGMGRGASLRGAAFYCNAGSPQSNFIFRNLKIWDVNPHIVEAGDAISLNAVVKLWVDHCSFKWVSDGNDIDGTKECTFSWNRWNGYNEYMCTKRDNYSAMIRASDITYDHIWWEGACGRDAKMYGATLSHTHMINNYHSDNTYYAAESGDVSNLMYIENTHFDGVRFPTVKIGSGVVYCNNNLYSNIGSHVIDWKNSSEPKDATAKFTPPYSYTLDNVNEVKAICMSRSGAGAQWGTMPLYTDVAYFSNKAPSVAISAPANGASFNNPSSITITSNASDADGSVSKVEYYSGTIKIGEATSSPYSFNLSALTACTYSIVAVATDNSGNKTMSEPITITVSKAPAVTKYIFTYDGSGNYTWDNTNNWAPKAVPTASDTTIIRSGESHLGKRTQTGLAYIETGATLKVTDTASIGNLLMQGGGLSVYTGGTGFPLTAAVKVEQNTSIAVGSSSTAVLTLNGSLSGSGNISKTNAGVLALFANASSYTGNWDITGGKLKVKNNAGIGSGAVTISNGSILDIEVANVSVYSVTISSGNVELDANLTVQQAIFNGLTLTPGQYTTADYPDFIKSTGTLTVIGLPDCAGVKGGQAKLDNCGICTGGTTGFAVCASTIEAETACSVEGIANETTNAGASNAYVNTTNVLGATASWNIASTTKQTVTFSIRYANGGTTNRNGKVILNGVSGAEITLAPTANWSTWTTATVKLALESGLNQLKLEATSADGLANIDLFYVSDGVSSESCTITSLFVEKQNDLTVFPNPTQDVLHLSKVTTWELYSPQGQLLDQNNGAIIRLDAFASGIYFLKTKDKTFTIIKK